MFDVITSSAIDGTKQYTNGGDHFPMSDNVIIQLGQSCFNSQTRILTVVAAVRNTISSTATLEIIDKVPRQSVIVPALVSKSVAMTALQSATASNLGYTLFSGTYTYTLPDGGEFSVSAIDSTGTRWADEYKFSSQVLTTTTCGHSDPSTVTLPRVFLILTTTEVLPDSMSHEHEECDAEPDSAHAPLLSSQPHRHTTRRSTNVSTDGSSLVIDPETLSYSYSYGPKGLAGLRHNYYTLICACFASIGGLLFGYDQGVIANVLVMPDFVGRWPVTPLEKGSMTAVLELGALLGALFAGIYADRYSRRHTIFVACVVFCVGSMFQCAAQSLRDLFIGRAVGGVGIGALSTLSPLYMAEISPPELRGSLMALEQFSIVLGVVFGFWTGFFTRSFSGSSSWRTPLAVQLIPGIILALGCAYLPPSPRLLILQGRFDEALKSLARLRCKHVPSFGDADAIDERLDPVLQIELLEMRVEAALIQRLQLRHADTDADLSVKPGFRAELSTWKRLFSKEYRERTWIGVLVMVFQQWSGINALLYYGPTLVDSVGWGSGSQAGSDDTETLVISGGIGIVQFLSVVPVIILIDRLGRKPLLRCGSLLMAVSHAFIALLVYQFSDDWEHHSVAAWMSVGCMYFFTFAYGISFGPVGWVLPSEVFPLSMRSKGVALSTASNWINNFLIGLVTPVMMQTSPSATFGTFGSACLLAYLWSTYCVPETANVSLEEMDAVFASSAGREDVVVRAQIEEDLGLRSLIRELGEGDR
ncbi:hypothetical protein AX17_004685 [Amanita inopinata Kibby_2008]|nr:hypothetical protein AX17_004685 [Amanita inopinata Kibby_2008]